MKNRNLYLLKNTIILGIGAFASKLVSFFLVPLYTNTLSPSDFGIVDLLFTIGGFLFPLFTLNISEAIYRFSLDKKDNKKEIYYSGFLCFTFSTIIGIIVIPILQSISTVSQYSYLFYLYLITLSLSQILLVFLKGQEKLKLYTIGNIIYSFFIAFLNIIFLLIFKMGIVGYFLAYIISNIILSIFCLFLSKNSLDLSNKLFDKKLFLKMIKYSVVLIPTSFMWWITNSSDRIMVTSLVSSAANGIYSISYKIPSILTVLSSIFTQAWVFSAIREKNSNDVEEHTNKIFSFLYLLLVIVSMIILIFLKKIFIIYVSADYYVAWQYVPILLFGFIFMTLATFISTSYNVHKDSKGFLISGLIGAFSNIVLNFILIPYFAVFGAAIATMISYIAVFIYRLIDTKKYVSINFNFKQYLLIFILLIQCILTYFNNDNIIFIQLVLLLITLILSKNNLIIMIRLIKNRRLKQ